jgi:hypothetical protein
MDRIVKEAIHIRMNKENFNRDNGFNPSRAWFPITRMLASQKAEPGKESNDLKENPQWLMDRPENGALTGINRRTGLST